MNHAYNLLNLHSSRLRLEHATRARPVYLAGLTLLGGGAFFLLAWLSRRRPPGD
ncbi:hypothetical protein [Bordetella pertussis]|uniref:hypothetical protein n=1 Tax=Bordetella pertussis TaxID=520 RepID=UPI000AAB012B|nr:hypothetical protein [Bordetella pertussis]UEA92604.1 hypothetical protein LK412_10120 [Bordetella pertussis]WLE77600.1 hypothetical protein KTP58_11160 [Bordetella pertussis]